MLLLFVLLFFLPGTYEVMDDDLPNAGKRFYRLEVALP